MALYQKFIIENDCLIMMNVLYHNQMVTDEASVKGGGWFLMNNYTNTCTFYGDSKDYGQARIDDILQCIKNKKVYLNICKTNNVADQFHFCYDNGSKIIELLRVNEARSNPLSTAFRHTKNRLHSPLKKIHSLFSFSKS